MFLTARPLFVFLHAKGAAIALVAILSVLSISISDWLQPGDMALLVASCVVGIFVAIAFVKIETAVGIFVTVAPFHFLVKAFLPESAFAPAWRDALFAVLLVAWLVQLALKRIYLPRHPLIVVMVLYLAWGTMEILNSANITVGVLGFRDVVRYAPLFLIVLSTIKTEKSIKRYLWIMVVTGLVVAIIGIVQSLLSLKIPLIEAYAERGYTPRAFGGLTLDRAYSILSGPNELGYYLAAVVPITIAIGLHSSLQSLWHKGLTAGATIVLLLGVLLTFSFSSFAALGTAAVLMTLRTKRSRRLMVVVLTVMVVVAAFAWSNWRAQYSDDLMLSTLFIGTSALDIPNPIIGNGYALLGRKPYVPESSLENATFFHGTDSFLLEIGWQLGWVGLILQTTILAGFILVAWKTFRDLPPAHFFRSTCLAVLGATVALAVTTVHSVPWNYIALDVNYFVLGAIVVWIAVFARTHKRITEPTGASSQ